MNTITKIHAHTIVEAMRTRTKQARVDAGQQSGRVRRDSRGRRRYNTLPVNRVCETGDDR